MHSADAQMYSNNTSVSICPCANAPCVTCFSTTERLTVVLCVQQAGHLLHHVSRSAIAPFLLIFICFWIKTCFVLKAGARPTFPTGITIESVPLSGFKTPCIVSIHFPCTLALWFLILYLLFMLTYVKKSCNPAAGSYPLYSMVEPLGNKRENIAQIT